MKNNFQKLLISSPLRITAAERMSAALYATTNTTIQTLLAFIALRKKAEIKNASAVNDEHGKKNVKNKIEKSVFTNMLKLKMYPKNIIKTDWIRFVTACVITQDP